MERLAYSSTCVNLAGLWHLVFHPQALLSQQCKEGTHKTHRTRLERLIRAGCESGRGLQKHTTPVGIVTRPLIHTTQRGSDPLTLFWSRWKSTAAYMLMSCHGDNPNHIMIKILLIVNIFWKKNNNNPERKLKHPSFQNKWVSKRPPIPHCLRCTQPVIDRFEISVSLSCDLGPFCFLVPRSPDNLLSDTIQIAPRQTRQ